METNNKIQMRHLGKTDILVTPIGLGVMEMAGGGGLIGLAFPVIPQEEKNPSLKPPWREASTGSILPRCMERVYQKDPWQPD